MIKGPFQILAIALAVLLGWSQFTFAWGVYNSDAAHMMSYLVYPVIETGNINYCISIEDSRFDSSRLDVEIRSALGAWLRYLPNVGVKNVTMTQVPCDFVALNLMVDLGPETKYSDLGGFQIPINESGRLYSYVKVDTAYTFKNQNISYKITDFDWFVETAQNGLILKNLAAYLYKISIGSPATVSTAAQELDIDYDTVFWTTYRIFVHEFGHSFGLCDTYDSQVQHCDPTLMSPAQPSSVMKDSNYFYITEDDATGFRMLFKNYLIK